MATNNSCDYAPTQYNVQTGGASGTLNNVAPSATSGVPVISQGAAAQPIFGTAVVAGGGTGLTSATAYAVLCGGTTSTGAFQSIASVGTSGQALLSNGAGALPTFQALTSTMMLGASGTGGLHSTVKQWIAPFGSTVSTTQAAADMVVPFSGTVSNLYVRLSANSSTSNVTVTVNKNGVNTVLVATCTANTTGTFSDTSDSFTVVAGDRIQFELSAGSVASSTTGNISVQYVH